MQLSRLTVTAATVVALALTASAYAQDRGRGGGRGFRGFGFGGRGLDKATLLGSEQVRGELKIGEEQAKKVDEILTAYRAASRELFQGFGRGQDLSDEERQKAREERTAKRTALTKETDKKIDAALEKEQLWRLNEIVLQQQGIDGVVTERVVAALELSEEQVGKIKASIEERDTKVRELMGSFRGRRGGGGDGGGGNFEEAREKMNALREDSEKSIMALLSDKQKEGYTKLKGKPFELDRQSLFRRGGRGGFGGGRGGAGDGSGGGRQRRRPPVDEGDSI